MLKVIELFAGIGSQTQALKNIGVEHEVVAIAEIDKFADLSYRALHNKNVLNLGDITKIEILPKADLWTYSFPCQDISVAGKQKGLDKGSSTRSGLLWEVERLLLKAKETNTLPKYLLLENVKNLIGKKFKGNYNEWVDTLKAFGYTTYTQVLNAKDYGIPQNRERVFAISILGEHSKFEFSAKQELTINLRDMLENEDSIAQKYYLNSTQISVLLNTTFMTERMSLNYEHTVATGTLMARDWKSPKKVLLGGLNKVVENIESKNNKLNVLGKLCGDGWENNYDQIRQVYDTSGVSPTLTACGGGRQEAKIAVLYNVYNNRVITDTAPSVMTSCGCNRGKSTILKMEMVDTLKIRKLTPREYWRLMGWKDEQIDKVKNAGLSNTQMYKQAGNGIVVNVLEAIFKVLFKSELNKGV